MNSASSPGRQICLVTVTYGKRQDLLQTLLDAIVHEPMITHVVVVGNGTPWLDDVAVKGAASLHKVQVSINRGSAEGYQAGISAGLATPTDFLWLMDDDLVPDPGAARKLLDAIIQKEAAGIPLVGTIAQRDGHTLELAGRRSIRPDSFLSFDFRTRLRRGGEPTATNAFSSETLPFAPFGGLLARHALFRTIGEPRADFVLYADDTEYTHRIVANGGHIVPVGGALVRDVTPSWNVGERSKTESGIARLLKSGSDFQAYYSLRNRTYFDCHVFARNRLIYRINRTVFMAALFIKSARMGKMKRYKLITHAIADGERAALGLNPAFPLPG